MKTLALLLILCPAARADDDRECVIDGVVKSVDAKTKEVTVTRDSGKETTVKLDADTKLRLDGREATFDRIKAKQEVRVVHWLATKRASHFGVWVETDRPPYTGRR